MTNPDELRQACHEAAEDIDELIIDALGLCMALEAVLSKTKAIDFASDDSDQISALVRTIRRVVNLTLSAHYEATKLIAPLLQEARK